jgi:hypothetical protein
MAFDASIDHTIMVHVSKDSPRIEAVAALTPLKPGHLVAWNANGDLIAHGTADGAAQKIFVVEDDRGTIADTYALGSTVIAYNMRPGDVVWGYLADAETVAIGDFLTSNGAGLLQAPGITPLPGSIIGVAKEALTAVGNVRIKVEVM